MRRCPFPVNVGCRPTGGPHKVRLTNPAAGCPLGNPYNDGVLSLERYVFDTNAVGASRRPAQPRPASGPHLYIFKRTCLKTGPILGLPTPDSRLPTKSIPAKENAGLKSVRTAKPPFYWVIFNRPNGSKIFRPWHFSIIPNT